MVSSRRKMKTLSKHLEQRRNFIEKELRQTSNLIANSNQQPASASEMRHDEGLRESVLLDVWPVINSLLASVRWAISLIEQVLSLKELF